MTVHQPAVSLGEFAHYLRYLTRLIDPARGWYGVFCERDPEGMRACLEGAEIPPWDVVDSLLVDLATARGDVFAGRESVRAAELHATSAAAHDRRPGGRQQLVERLELMLREQAHAAQRQRAAHEAGAAGTLDAQAAAWARDDHERASARCAELRRRLAALRDAAPEAPPLRAAPAPTAAAPAPDAAPAPGPAAAHAVPAPAAPVRKRPRGARFAGLDVDEESPVSAVPVLPVPPVAAAVPRGARFGGAPGVEKGPVEAPVDPEAVKAARNTVAALLRLRTEGRSGEAHGVLCEAAGRTADQLPVLAAELQRAGLDADWATLLWEVSSLPPAALAAAAAALSEAGRPEDCDRLLRQGVARPAAEIADAVTALDRAGRGPQAQALLGAFVRVRTPQDAARVAESDPRRLVPQLLAAARGVSQARERDVVHALRVAGIG
uniref:UL36 very large tegument protein n=1 Tax=Streptomyces sp. NBC_00008 TaxID=2903610 RepID=A0AAU2VJZ4_9ACTN